MIWLVLFSIAFAVLLIGFYTDLKTREVPDWANYAGIIAGLGVRLLWSVSNNDWGVFVAGVLGFVAFFLIGCAMFYSGQWGGGDSKLLMAMGALLGLDFSLDSPAVVFLLWSILSGAAYGSLWSFAIAIKNWKRFARQYVLLVRSLGWVNGVAVGILVLGFAFAIIVDDVLLRVLLAGTAVLVPVLCYLTILVKAVEQCCMLKVYDVSQLTEGDWIARPVKVDGRLVCGPKDLGVTKKQIAMLKKLKVRQVLVREGIPFVPSFLVAFVMMLLFGNPLLLVMAAFAIA